MSIQYKMIQLGDNLNPEGQQKTSFYPLVVRRKTVKTKELSSRLAHQKRQKAIEMKSLMEMLLVRIEEELLNGNSVCLDGFGTFSLTAQCKRKVNAPNEVRAESISVKKVVFTPSKPLRQRLKLAQFTKTE